MVTWRECVAQMLVNLPLNISLCKYCRRFSFLGDNLLLGLKDKLLPQDFPISRAWDALMKSAFLTFLYGATRKRSSKI